MDRLEAVLPRVDAAEEAGRIVRVMARITRSASAAVFFERGGALRWLAGDHLSPRMAAVIRRAWRAQRRRILTGTAFSEPGTPAGETPVPSWLMWMRRPAARGLDAVYFAGPELRPLEACSAHLIRLAALLGRLH
jgi:hypothetical protein